MLKYFYSIFIFLFSCCGYSTRSTLPSQYKSIAITIVENQTVKPGLDDLLTNQLIDDFTKDRSLKIIQIDRADIVLECRIINYERSPQSYTSSQEIITYKITLGASVTASDKTKPDAEPLFNGEVSAWKTYAQTVNEEYGIDTTIVKLSQEIKRKVLTTW